MQKPHPYLENTVYINLDYRTDRKQHTEEELAKIGVLSANRLSATKMHHGAVGCSMSHIRCLEMAKKNNWTHVFIAEDDITFMNPELFLSKLREFGESDIEWDVLIIAGNTAPPFGKATDFCIRTHNVQSTTGYIVKQHYYDTMIANFREGVAKLMKDPENKREFAIDIYWKQLQNSGKWYILIPLSVYQYSTYSDVENRMVDYKGFMLDLDKKELIRLQQQRQLQGQMRNMNF
uniref:Glycosyl transferase family 25 domain-containing protein n=1 Tax=viral metagenome TaxID=1070528 RepID=A0A6C0HY40_9ZZZZ